jgi:hypothetical protein
MSPACIGKHSCSSSLIGSVFFDVRYVDCDGEQSCIGAVFDSTYYETQNITCASEE